MTTFGLGLFGINLNYYWGFYMISSVLVFGGRSTVDCEEFRWQLLRVPEVSQVLKEIQGHLDKQMKNAIDITAFLMSDNSRYLSSHLWRDFASQIVQVGLYRRYKKHSPAPRFVVGETSGISALKVCMSQQTTYQMVTHFLEMLDERSKEAQQENFLVGHSLEALKAYEYMDGQLFSISENKETISLLNDIAKDHIIDQVISLGTCDFIRKSESEKNIAVMESVSMDPMLSWLWPYLQSA